MILIEDKNFSGYEIMIPSSVYSLEGIIYCLHLGVTL